MFCGQKWGKREWGGMEAFSTAPLIMLGYRLLFFLFVAFSVLLWLFPSFQGY